MGHGSSDGGSRKAADAAAGRSAEEARRLIGQLFHAAFKTGADAYVLVGRDDGRLAEVNDRFLEMFGYRRDEVIGRTSLELGLWTYPDQRREVLAELAAAGEVRNWPVSARRKGGEVFPIHYSIGELEGSDPPLLLGAIRDVTEQRRIEGELRASEARFRAVTEHSHAGIYTIQDGAVSYANPAAEKIFGYGAGELIDVDPLSLIHPDDRALATDPSRRRSADDGETINYEVRGIRKDGAVIVVEVLATRMELNGRPIVVGNVLDITERRAAEHARQASEARFRTLVDKAPSAIGISRSGRTIYVNQKYLEMFGFGSGDELEGKPLREQWSATDADIIEERARRRSLGLPVPIEYEGTARRKDGSLFPAHVSVAIVDLPDGPATLGFITDLSEQRRSEVEKARLEAQFRQAQKMEAIGQLAGGVAHDFNNILAAILMQTELAGMADHLPPDVAEGIRHVREYAERAANLTRQLLLFSRRQVMQASDVDVNELVINLAKMLQRIIGEDLRLHLHLSSQPLTTHGDPGMLEQVLMNLVVNARDAMPSGGDVVIETSGRTVSEGEAAQLPDTPPGHYVCLRVTDTGCGISADILPRIFEPFFTTKDPAKGTGLGLATVFGIVKQHEGSVLVESAEGRGTTIRVLLPVLKSAAKAPPQTSAQTRRRGTETILVVEDDESVRKLTRVTLECQGYAVLDAAGGNEALRLWLEHRAAIRLLLTDLVMPDGLNGRELAARLRADCPSLPVVFMSGYSSDLAGRELTLESGQRFVQKPYPPHQLLDVVRQLIDEPDRSAR
jgi:PAS domain S-box-containing protein